MKKAVIMVQAMLLSCLVSIPAFADHIAPGPKEEVRGGLSDYLPLIVLSVLGLIICTGTALLVVFLVRRKRNSMEKQPKED